MTDVAAPDVTEWWTVDDIAAAARHILRLSGTDVDAARIEELVPVAGQRLNAYWDRTADNPIDPADPGARSDLIDLTVAMYRQKDSPPSSPDLAFGLGYQPADPMSQVRGQSTPRKQRWGMG